MKEHFKIKKGLDIPLAGEAPLKDLPDISSDKYAILPQDFRLLSPRLLVKEGDDILAGEPIIQNKLNENIFITSPISGKVTAIIRGEKRILKQIIITPNSSQEYKIFNIPNTLDRDNIIKLLLESGLWVNIRQRPYGIIANPSDIPKAIYISAFDSSPLAPDPDYLIKDEEENFQKGIDIIKI